MTKPSDELIHAALVEFAERGYEAATVRGITRRAGVNIGKVSYSFGGKDALADAVIDHLLNRLVVPEIPDLSTIGSRAMWRAVLKSYLHGVIEMFNGKSEPNRFIPPLYRHEATHPSSKKRTLQNVVMKPIFMRLEQIVSVYVHDPFESRLLTLAAWNLLLDYAFHGHTHLAAYLPDGMTHEVFGAVAVDFIVDRVLGANAPSVGGL
mgnify:CR=1 FL=1